MHKKHEENPVITWNTGREYSKEGQKMAATLHGTKLHYMDFTRELEGEIEVRRFEYSTDELKKIAMFCYDHHIGTNFIEDAAVKSKLQSYEDLVDDIKRQEAFSG